MVSLFKGVAGLKALQGAPMAATAHSLLSSYRGMLLQHLFAGEVMRHVWLSVRPWSRGNRAPEGYSTEGAMDMSATEHGHLVGDILPFAPMSESA